MRRLFFFLQLLMAVMLACQSLTPTPSATPMPTASATNTPTRTPASTATVADTSMVTITPIVPVMSWPSTLKKGDTLEYGADDTAMIVCDQANKVVGIIDARFRITISSPGKVTHLRVSTYQTDDQFELITRAREICPNAKIKFLAHPNLTFGEWLSILPPNWAYAKVPDVLLDRNDYSQAHAPDPRKVPVSWAIGQVICAPYDEDPGNLPKGINPFKSQVYQFMVLEEKLDVNIMCGSRKGGVLSVWAEQFSLLNGDTSDEALHLLMGDALTWMLSKSADDESFTTQEFYRGGYANFARFIIGHPQVANWVEAQESLYKKQK